MDDYALSSNESVVSYDYLKSLSPDRWAWEFLRRNADFRADARARREGDIRQRAAPCAGVRLLRANAAQTLAERWGLVVMVDPDLNAQEADVVWSEFAFPDQVHVHCNPRQPHESCEIWDRTMGHCLITHLTDPVGREYLLLRRGDSVVQVRCSGLSLLGLEPVRMSLTISQVDGYERSLKTQKAAIALYGAASERERPAWTKTTQVLRDCLITLDCLELEMSRRDIASVFYGKDRVAEEWAGPSMKHTIRYLVKKAEGLRDKGYLAELLNGQMRESPRALKDELGASAAMAPASDVLNLPLPALGRLHGFNQPRKSVVRQLKVRKSKQTV